MIIEASFEPRYVDQNPKAQSTCAIVSVHLSATSRAVFSAAKSTCDPSDGSMLLYHQPIKASNDRVDMQEQASSSGRTASKVSI